MKTLDRSFRYCSFHFLPLDFNLLISKIDSYGLFQSSFIKNSPLYISGIEDVFDLNKKSVGSLEENYLDYIGTFIMILDANKVVQFINKRGLAILKSKKEDVVGKNFVENFIPKNFKKDVEHVAQSLTDDEINNISYYVNPIVDSQGNERIISWTNTSLKNDEGQAIAFLTSGEDITNQVQNQKKLKKVQERQNALFEALPHYIFIKDRDLRFYAVNTVMAELFHTTVEDVIGKRDSDFFPEDIVEAFTIIDKKVLETGEVIEVEENFIKDGEMRVLSTVKWPIFGDEGDITGLLGIATDITDKKRSEERLVYQSRLAQMGEMLSIIAHQWRQPLTAVGAIVANVKVKTQLGRLYETNLFSDMDKIDDQLAYLSQTIDDFRNFFKPDKGKNLVRIPDIIEKSLKIIEANLAINGVDIIKEVCSDVELMVYENELVQVFLNFFNNSLDVFLERDINNPKIIISCEVVKDWIEIVIEDNGQGASEDVINHLWDPYYSTKMEQHGTGLGLYMVQQIIESHCGGSVKAFNGKEGLSFMIKLPLEKS
jgi:PAS domain S-box-containing protein